MFNEQTKQKRVLRKENVDRLLSCKRDQSGRATELRYSTYVIVWAATPPAVLYVYSTSLVIEFTNGLRDWTYYCSRPKKNKRSSDVAAVVNRERKT